MEQLTETEIPPRQLNWLRVLLITLAVLFAALVVYCLIPWQWRFDVPACNAGDWTACHPYR
jgi:hypothetical protein